MTKIRDKNHKSVERMRNGQRILFGTLKKVMLNAVDSGKHKQEPNIMAE